MKRLTYYLLCLFLSIGVVTAQTTRVTGTVTSAEDGEPVIGASIVVKGTTVGTVTTFDGTFSLDVPQNARTVVVSYLGMESQEVAVSPVINLALRSDTQALDEVIVTALGLTREKKSLGYAMQEVKSDDLTKAGQMNVANSLSGKFAGIQITQQGGQVGASQNIVIRGNSSFGNNQPLIVVDGVPMTNDNGTGANVNLGSGLNDINPNDIESISVLKGGSAALYGMRAGNGVILITTKSAKNEKKVVVTYDGDFTVDKVYGLPKFQNKYGQGYYASEYDYKAKVAEGYEGSYQDFASEYGFSYRDGLGNGVNDNGDESWGPRLDIGLMLPQFNSPVVDGVRQATPWVSNPNNIKDFFQLGYSTSHTIGFTSTSENTTTRASLSYRGQEGTMENTSQKRYGATINTQYKVSKYVDFDLSANYVRTTSPNIPVGQYDGSNPMQSILQWFGRQVSVKDLKANWDQKENGEYTHYNWNREYATNPYWTLNKSTTNYVRDRVFGKSSLWIKPTDWLKFEGRLGIDHYNSDQLSVIEWSVDYPKGYFRDINRHTTEINADFIAYFNKQIGDFSVSALAGANYRDYDYTIKTLGADNLVVPGLYTVANADGISVGSENHEIRRSNSVYANASIGWKSQLYLDVSVRNDWDSTIEDSFFYPSFSGSWILTETIPSLAETSWLNFLKLRGGWAKIGSATEPYRNGAYYEADITRATIYGTTLYRNPLVFPPKNLRPEMVKTWEIGLETTFIQNRIHLDLAYYQKRTTDQIMEANVSTPTGYTSMVINAGEISNKGVEIQLRADILKNTNGLNWSATLNWAKDKSKIVELYTDPVTGQSLESYRFYFNGFNASTYAMKGETWGSIVGTGYVYNDDGSILVENGMPVSQSSQVVGDVTPDWLAGLRNEFTYKDWTLGFLLDFRKGGDVYSLSQAFGSYTGIYDYTAKGDIRENGVIAGKNVLTDKVFKTADGKINDVAVNAEDFFGNYYSIVEMAVIDGSFLKLREAYITYTFPKSIMAKTKFIGGARVSLIGTNLALLWTHKSNLNSLDPESTRHSGNEGVGMETNSVPPSRSIGLKVGLTF